MRSRMSSLKIKALIMGAFTQLAIVTVGVAQNPKHKDHIPFNPQREAYYGDLHLHTSYSFDAYLLAGTRVDPDGAYRFARGEPRIFLDEEVRRTSPPLDFMAVTDHAEVMGVLNTLEDPNSPLSRSEIGNRLKDGD